MAASAAAPALMRLRAALPDDADVLEAFDSKKLTPVLLAECCNKASTPLHSSEIRALLNLFGEANLIIDGRVLAGAIISAPRPLETTQLPPGPLQPPEPEPPFPPPPRPTLPTVPPLTTSLPDGWAPPVEPPAGGLATQREWLTQQRRPAPYATLPEGAAPQWPEARQRHGDSSIGQTLTHPLHLETPRTIEGMGYTDGYLGETPAAYAARAAGAAGKGAAGKGSAAVEKGVAAASLDTARAATLHVPNQKLPSALHRPRTAPYAYDYYTGPVDVSDGAPPLSARSAAPMHRPLDAPFATLDNSQLMAIAQHDAERRERAPARSSGVRHDLAPADDPAAAQLHQRNRIGPTLWDPPPAPRGASEQAPPAGAVPIYGDRSADPVPTAATWMTTGMARPVSRRGSGSARPATASQISFG